MLYELGLENFKPFGTLQTAPLRPITLIYGPNSGGKSSIIQALMLLRQSIEASATSSTDLIPRGDYVDLGSFKSLVHKHDLSRSVRFRFSYDKPALSLLQRGVWLTPPADQSRRVSLGFVARSQRKQRGGGQDGILSEVRYELNGGQTLDVVLVRNDKPERWVKASVDTVAGVRVFTWAAAEGWRSLADYLISTERMRTERVSRLRKQQAEDLSPETHRSLDAYLSKAAIVSRGLLPSRTVSTRETEGTAEETAEFLLPLGRLWRPLDGMVWEFEGMLGRVSYLGPLRSHPARYYLLSGGETPSVGVRGENTPQMIYHRRDTVRDSIRHWFRRFEIPYHFSINVQGDEVSGEMIVMTLRDERLGVPVAPSDVGFGIGQLLPIIVEGLVVQNGIICVEQPEIHLHPRLQAHVADLFIETAGLKAKRKSTGVRQGNQWIVETHSEALILRLQRRIREKVISPDDVSVLYVEPGSPTGSKIRHIRLDEMGNFVNEWPQGFFEERFTELYGEGS